MHKNLTYAINGCLFNVHNALGNIWSEDVYEKALESELTSQGLSVQRQKEFEVAYFDQKVGHYRTDLLVEDTVIVELKAVPRLLPLHRAQLISYLKGFGKPLGILANFGGASVEHATYPNKTDRKKALIDQFDFEKIRINEKEDIKDLLLMANRILVTLGPGYLQQNYIRHFHLKRGLIINFNAIHLDFKYLTGVG